MTNYSMVKPTKYAGITFRSRLEARWAVFFDALGISWEYEPETFAVDWYGESIQYTPDFRIGVDAEPHHRYMEGSQVGDKTRPPDLKTLFVYAEVKPTVDAIYSCRKKIAASIEWHGPCGAGLLLLGPIPNAEHALPIHPMLVWAKGVGVQYGNFDLGGTFDRRNQGGDVACDDLPDGIQFNLTWHNDGANIKTPAAVLRAYNAARNARFGLGGSQ